MLTSKPVHVIIFLLFISQCLAQSGGGGGGGGGAIAGILGIIFCPCITVGACVIYCSSKRVAKREKIIFIGGVEPSSTTVGVIPISGKYCGSFCQDIEYAMEVQLVFTPKKSEIEGVTKYDVSGKGQDCMGSFSIKSGECAIGKSARIYFIKSYSLFMRNGHSRSIHQLVYTGEMDLLNIGHIDGTWKFAEKLPSEKCPIVTGPFTLECSTKLQLQGTKEACINIDDDMNQETTTLPQYLQSSKINLEKSPILNV